MEAVLKFASTNSAKRLRREIFRFAQEKIGKRLEMETDRLDFMTYVKRYNDEKGMSRDEIDSTFTTLIVAGKSYVLQKCSEILTARRWRNHRHFSSWSNLLPYSESECVAQSCRRDPWSVQERRRDDQHEH
jgi:hypothetical protein